MLLLECEVVVLGTGQFCVSERLLLYALHHLLGCCGMELGHITGLLPVRGEDRHLLGLLLLWG